MKIPAPARAILRALHPQNFLKLLSWIFGTLSWRPPLWIAIPATRLDQTRRARPRAFWGAWVTLAVIALGVGAFAYWRAHRPRPEFVSLTIEAPAVTENKKDLDALRPNPAVLRFGASAARLEAIGKTVARGVAITPAIGGQWLWQDDKTLVFTPSEDWPGGQSYAVRFAPDFFPDHVRLEKLDWSFAAPAFAAEIASFAFYQDPAAPEIKKMVATVRFSHPVDTANFKERVSLKTVADAALGVAEKSFKTEIKYDKHRREAYVHSETLVPPARDEFLKLALAAGIRPQNGPASTLEETSTQAILPGLDTFFRVERAATEIVRDTEDEPVQTLVIVTKDAVKPGELAGSLEAFQLPADKPAANGTKEIKNYAWQSAAEVTPEIFKLATPVKLNALPALKEYQTLNSFTYRAPEGAFLLVRVAKGLKSFGGYALREDYAGVLRAPNFPRELHLMHEGSLLSLTGERKLPFMSRGVDHVRIEFARVLPDEINDFIAQGGGDFSYGRLYGAEEELSEIFTETRATGSGDPAAARYGVIDFSERLAAQKGLFHLTVREYSPDEDTDDDGDLYDTLHDKRIVLVTDMGLLVKKNADGTREVFVHSLAQGGPVAGAEVSVLGKNGLPVASGITDADGRVAFAALDTLRRDKKPVAFVAKHGDDLSFMPLERYDREMNFQDFDVGGVYLYGEDRLRAFVYSDRGVYRPGETAHAGVIVKSTDWSQNLAGVPIEIAMKDPRGLPVRKRKIALPASGYVDFEFATEASAPTGTYAINAYFVEEDKDDEDGDGETENLQYIGSTTVKVEEFTPDQMKITARLTERPVTGWAKPGELKGGVSLRNLYGTPATDRRVTAKISLSPAYPDFAGYEGFRFYNPLKLESAVSQELAAAQTDAEGQAAFDLGLERFEKATYRLEFSARGFSAAGGKGVESAASVLVSPLDSLVAYKPDAELSFLKRDSAHVIRFIAVAPDLKSVPVKDLRAQLIEKRYVSTLLEQDDGTLKYQSVLTENPVAENAMTWDAEGFAYDVPTQTAGDFELRLFDPDGVKVCQVAFSVAGDANLARSLDKTAELDLKLDREEYAPGEEIEISVKAPYAGTGLITIERDQVYATRWFAADTTASVQKIRIPDDFEGGGYVNVAFVRSRASDEIYMSPLSYGAAPFSVNLDRRRQNVELDAPELVKPGETLSIGYRAASGAKIVVYAVDEGILQFAGYPTPEPLETFFEKRALEVRSFQTLDLVLPEHSVYKSTASTGGDQSYKFIGNNLNPFRRKSDPPVAFWSGILDAAPEGGRVEYRVPDSFNGSLRVMAVAVNNDAVGVAEASARVRGPFIITPSLPLFVAPGDVFDVNLIVANNLEGSGLAAAVKVGVETPPGISLSDNASVKTLTIAENTEAAVSFQLRAGDTLGEATLKFSAAAADAETESSSSLSVRPPTPYQTTLAAGFFDDGEATAEVARELFPEYRKLKAGVSSLPTGLSRSLAAYLAAYPHDCTEQLVSKALAVAVLAKRPEFAAEGTDPAAFEKTLGELRTRQSADGSFRYWPERGSAAVADGDGELAPNDRFATAYAVHFLIEAKELGLPAPRDMLDSGKSALLKILAKPVGNDGNARLYAYSAYLVTRLGEVTSNPLANLRQYLDASGTAWRKNLTGAYVAAIYRMLQHEDEAESLIGDYAWGGGDKNFFDDPAANDAQYVALLARHFPDRLKRLSGKDILKLVEPLGENRYNTLSSAHAILALDAYAKTAAAPQKAELAIAEVAKSGQRTPLRISPGLFGEADFSEAAARIFFSGPAGAPAFYHVLQSGYDKTPPARETKEGLEIAREFLNQNGEKISEVEVGDAVETRLTLRTVDGAYRDDIAVVDLLPGGFEVGDDPALREALSVGRAAKSWHPAYADVREDRVVLYGAAGPNAETFSYRIRAVSPGVYQVPPAYGESMYRRNVRAGGVAAGQTLKIVPARP